jgi:tRNA uridine 5-carbamoylmethylation protein Kti12
MTKVILITGHNESGKSTIARDLKNILERYGSTCCIKSFATPLKQLATYLYSYSEEEKSRQRQILEGLALELKKCFGKGLFAYTLLDTCLYDNNDYIIIDDLRYKEEYQVISEFYESIVIKTPDKDIIDLNDAIRLNDLIEYFNINDVPYFEMEDFNLYKLKKFVLGLK